MQGPKWPFLLRYVIDFPQVDGWSTDTPGLGCHIRIFLSFSLLFLFIQTTFEDDFSEDEWLKSLLP